jgi:hypothetical protein
MTMNQQTLKYPSRADTLALLKARERAAAAPQSKTSVIGKPQDILVCYAPTPFQPR